MTPERVPLLATLSDGRFKRYRTAAAGVDERALDLYIWNVAVSAAIWHDVAIVEVALRNAMNEALSSAFSSNWFVSGIDLFDAKSVTDIERAKAAVSHGPRTPQGRVVAELMLGFWVRLLGKGDEGHAYDETLWRRCLRDALPGVGGARAKAYPLAQVAHVLRNRIAHHEHIVFAIGRPGSQTVMTLPAAHGLLLQLAGSIDADLGTWLGSASTFGAVWRARLAAPG